MQVLYQASPAVVEPDLTGLVTTDHDLIVTNQTAIANQTPVFIKANYPVYDQAPSAREILDSSSMLYHTMYSIPVTERLWQMLDSILSMA